MEHAQYHLIFEGFKPGVSKTAVSFTLKDQLNLSDKQLADMMAGRETVLRQNLDKKEAVRLGKDLMATGLVVKAKALAVNQKNSPEEVRKHLMQGGLDQYFASRYRHPDEDLETMFSLILLAALAVGTYLLLPILGLMILKPVLSLSVWSTQLISAVIQTTIGALMFVPAFWLFPRPAKIEGLELDRDTEELLFALIDNVSIFLSAPSISKVVLVETPTIVIHQTPKQWLTGSATLELGLPVMEMLNMKQLVGLLAIRFTPLSSTLYSKTWGLFIQWYTALRTKQKSWAMLLRSWVKPIQEHQKTRGFDIARALVGYQSAKQLQKLDKRFEQLSTDWPEFIDYCQRLRIRGSEWRALIGKFEQGEKASDDSQALFRIDSPALWLLSTINGYQKMFLQDHAADGRVMNSQQLWKHFQWYIPAADAFQKKLLRPEALFPPVGLAPKKTHQNAILVNRRASQVVNTQKQLIEQTVGLKEKPKKPVNLQALSQKWRETSAGIWPKKVFGSKQLPLLTTIFGALQTLQQMEAWMSLGNKLSEKQLVQKNHNLSSLAEKWLKHAAQLPALPLLGNGAKLSDQIPLSMEPQDIEAQLTYWQNVISIYWVGIAGRLLEEEESGEEA